MLGFKEFLVGVGSDNEIINLYLHQPKMTVAQIATQANKSEADIYRILHANHVSPNRQKSDHQTVHSLAGMGWGIRQIAEFTGYTPRNVRYILAKNLTEQS